MTGPRLFASAGTALAAMAVPAHAQTPPDAEEPIDRVVIEQGQASGNSGRIAVNVVAGDRNQQAGAAAIAIGDTTVLSQSLTQLMIDPSNEDRRTAVSIGAGAFSNNAGLVSVNVTAGASNQSANLAALSIYGSGAISDQALAQMRAPTAPAASPAPSLASANDGIVIDDAAFAANSGLVQVNVVGGERNSSANTFALNVSAGGKP